MTHNSRQRSRVLVVTCDTLGARMAGPAMRAWHIAEEVARVADVRLLSTASCTVESPAFETAVVDDEQLKSHVDWCDVIVFQGHVIHHHPWISETEKIIVADIYDPMHLETLEQGKYLSEESRMYLTRSTVEVLNVQIKRADYMLCASEKQRDFWLGQLAGMGRINPLTYDQDVSLRTLLGVAPFGVTNEVPVQSRHAIKGTIPGISPNDKVLLWGGGIYNWFDPLTLIHAVHKLSLKHDNVRLFFLGMNHPNPDVPVMKMSDDAQQLASDLGLTDSVVFFNHEWVDYDDRVNYLCDADVGVSTHFSHVETAFSFRTRILDYLWAGLPIVATDGDTFEPIINAEGLGVTVSPENVDQLADALETVLFTEAGKSMAENASRLARSMTWQESLEPLVAFCADPHRAPDLLLPRIVPHEEHIKALETRIKGIESSTSWRITAPLRKLMSLRRR